MAGKIILAFEDNAAPTEAIEGEIPLHLAIVALEVLKTRLVNQIVAAQMQAQARQARQGLVMPDGTPVRGH